MKEIAGALREAGTILISSHERPDGDALGSELALLELAGNIGKTAEVVNESARPGVYAFLPLADRVRRRARRAAEPDLAVSLDVPNVDRLGGVSRYFARARKTVNIDHHLRNQNGATYNWVDTRRSSVGEMVLELAEHVDKVTPTMATNLFVALLTDTGRFTFSNTTAESFAAARRLVKYGADPHAIAVQLYQSSPEDLFRLAGKIQAETRLYCQGRVGLIRLTYKDLEKSGVSSLDTQDFSEMPRSIAGVEVGVFLREESPDFVKVSLRSKGRVDVAQLARLFGGGGHKAAAGFTMSKPLRVVQNALLKELRRVLDEA